MATFVLPAFDHAPNELRSLYRNRVQDFPGGFRRVDLVPKVLLLKRIAKDTATDPTVALTVLRNWFRSKSALHDEAVKQLQSLGYAVHEPDFENDTITHQSLAPEHIHEEDEAYYFSPGTELQGVDKLELTVMTALLGWFPELPKEH
ncbi:MAG: hypothetical protein HY961_01810 [Ignavibacteriae bacterium]|nr:hypothetical protein [Ignavibacteriota bacterium]